ncbi:MAG: FG-GAP-like repeat-containing protein [Armatimonadota bacterium]
MRNQRLIAIAGAAVLLIALAFAAYRFLVPGKPWQGITPEEYARLEVHRVRGIGLMENPKSEHLALPEFEAIRKAQPRLAFGYVNSAAATIVSQREQAVELAKQGAELAPESSWAWMVLGEAYGTTQPDEATKAFETAVARAPEDPRILGPLLNHLNSIPGDHESRIAQLQQRIYELAPANVAAQAPWLVTLAQRGEYEPAQRVLEEMRAALVKPPVLVRNTITSLDRALKARSTEAIRHARTLSNVLSQTSEFSKHRALIYGNTRDPANLVMREWDVPPPPLAEPAAPQISVSWTDVTDEVNLADVRARGVAPVGIGDVDLTAQSGVREEGQPQNPVFYRPDLAVGPSPNEILINSESGFAAAKPGTADGESSPLVADLNGDFSLDLYVAAPEGDRVWLNSRSAIVAPSGLQYSGMNGEWKADGAMPGRGPGSATAVDLDHDGDLDIIRTSAAEGQPAIRYLRNQGKGTFEDITERAGLTLPSQGARQTVFGDFDANGVIDLFVVRAYGSPVLLLNQRQDVFKNASQAWGLRSGAGALAAAVADFDRDGDWDIAVAGRDPHGTLLYRNRESQGFEADAAALPLDGFQALWVTALDYDNDTWIDLAFAGEQGLRLLRNNQGRFDAVEVPQAAGELSWVEPLDYDQDGDLDLLAAAPDGALRLLRNDGGNQNPWQTLDLEKLDVAEAPIDPSQPHPNNSFGIGAVVEPLTPWDRQKILVTRPQIHMGLGRSPKAAAIRIMWTNGVPQNLVAPEPRQAVHFREIPSGSCPFLYTWDGEKWNFHADFNWKSPLGMLAARGVPIPHDQTLDWVKIPGEKMTPIGDYLGLIATEELREVSYFDLIRLVAVDHPAETEVFVDERFIFGPPAPYQVYTATDRRLPKSATNESGADLLPLLRERDNEYTPVPGGPYRGVMRPFDLILDLGQVNDPANVRLFLNGWLFPSGSSINVAAAQNPRVPVVPPTLYVGDGRGGWKEVDRTVGLPTGKRKTMVLDLSNRFVGSDFRVKLTTTAEIRWDQAFFTSGEAPVRIVETEAPLTEAMLRERGYGRHYREVPNGPDMYDYQDELEGDDAPGWPDIAGAYTRLGDCSPLLKKVDDQYAIVAPGDEIRFLFDARKLPKLPAGWKRDYVLISDGWTKDADPNTLLGEMVEPLPFHGMKQYPPGPGERFPDTPAHRAWKREWNTRIKTR